MEYNAKEIALIIDECFYYCDQIYKLCEERGHLELSFSNSYNDEDVPWEERGRRADSIHKEIEIIDFKSQAFLSQLILDLNHLFKFGIYESYKPDLVGGKFIRLITYPDKNTCNKKTETKEVKNLKDAITFFRDAIGHPEHYPDVPSPRANPEFRSVYPFRRPTLNKMNNGTDFGFTVSKGTVWLKADILCCLEKLKTMCVEADNKCELNNFLWKKYN